MTGVSNSILEYTATLTLSWTIRDHHWGIGLWLNYSWFAKRTICGSTTFVFIRVFPRRTTPLVFSLDDVMLKIGLINRFFIETTFEGTSRLLFGRCFVQSGWQMGWQMGSFLKNLFIIILRKSLSSSLWMMLCPIGSTDGIFFEKALPRRRKENVPYDWGKFPESYEGKLEYYLSQHISFYSYLAFP